jgi:DNA polymerase alpha subunit B
MFPVCVVFLTRPSSPDLLKYAMDTKPDVLVLMGPFVDAEHRIIRGEDVHVPGTNSGGGGGEGGGPLDASFEEVFAWGVRDRLEAFTAAADAAGYSPAVVGPSLGVWESWVTSHKG